MSVIRVAKNVAGNLNLVRSLSQRMLHSSFRQAALGWFWLIGQPLLTMAMFTYVFGAIFQGRYGDYARETIWQYAVGVYMSLTLFNFAADVLIGSVSLLENYRDLMRKTAVAPELIIVAQVASCFVRFVAGFLPALLLATLIVGFSPGAVGLLVVLPGYILFVTGIAFILAPLGRRYPDLRQLAGIITTLLMWCSAIFYSKTFVLPVLQAINPILQMADLARQLVLWGRPFSAFIKQVIFIWIAGVITPVMGIWLLDAYRKKLND